MPSISIRDTVNAEIVTANPQVTSGLGKYLKGASAQLLAGAEVASQLRTDLSIANAGERGLRLTWADAVPLGSNAVLLTIDAGASVMIGVYNRTGMHLLENTFIGTPLKVPAAQAFVSISIRPTLELGVQGQVGALSFGFSAGSQSEWRSYAPFDLTASPITVADACKVALEHFVVPNTTDDLKQMRQRPAGTLACVSGHGQLRFGAALNVVAAINPLASLDTLAKLGRLEVNGGASAAVGVTATVSGGYQIRAQTIDGATVRLGFHTASGQGLEIALGASAGPGISLGERDLLAMLFKGTGGLDTPAREDLVEGGITSEQLDRVAAAMKTGLSRKLEVALAAQFSALRHDEAAFLYDVEVDRLDATGAAAIDAALAGDLSHLTALESEAAGHGIRVLQSRTQELRKKTISWRINLVGIVNVLSVSELVRTGTIVHDEVSGELLITDKVTSDRVGAIVGAKTIRKLLYESALMTLTYKASGLDVNTGLEASQSFFFFDHDANRQRMSDYLDAVAALELIDDAAANADLGSDDDFGKASLVLETTFNQAASERVFGQPGPPPDQESYEQIGKRALLALVQPGDPDEFRRIPLADAALWKRMKDAGQPSFPFVLPPPITGGGDARSAQRVAMVAADYSVIVWWSEAMTLAATQLAEMRAFLRGRTASDLEGDAEFRERRTDLGKAIAKAIRRNTATFDDPWGLVALFMAADGAAAAAATVVSPKLTLFRPE